MACYFKEMIEVIGQNKIPFKKLIIFSIFLLLEL